MRVVAFHVATILCFLCGCGSHQRAATTHDTAAAARATPSLRAMTWNVDSAALAAGPCEATADNDAPPHNARLQPGQYAFTLIATKGRWAGRRARGRLWLAPLDTLSGSPRREAGKARSRSSVGREGYLYGATDLAFDSVGAPMLPREYPGSDPRSENELYPGVLALSDEETELMIGTVANRRDGVVMLDGAGIWLPVRRLGKGGFAGFWGSYAILIGGTGYFCASRVGAP